MANTITALLKLAGDASGALAALKDVEGGLSKLDAAGKQAQKIGGLMTAGITAPLIGLAGVAAKTANDFDSAFSGVNAVLKLSGDELTNYKNEVIDFSRGTSKSAADVANSLRGIVSSGFEAGDAMSILKVSVDAAGNMMSDTATTTRAFTSVIQAYGLAAEDVGHVADVLEKAATSSALQFEELTGSIGKAVGTGSAAGVAFEELAGALMTISDAGYDAAEASTSLNQLMTVMLKPGEDLAEVIQSWGYETGEAALQAEGLEGVIRLLSESTGGSAAQMTELLGNVRAQRAAFALARQDGDAFAGSLDKVAAASEGAGEHAELAHVRHQKWQYTIQRLQSDLEVMAIRVGNRIMPSIVELANATRDAIPAFEKIAMATADVLLPALIKLVEIAAKAAEWFGKLPDPVLGVAGSLTAVAAAAGPVVLTLATMTRSVKTFAPLIGTLIAKLGALKIAYGNVVAANQLMAQGFSASQVASTGLAGKIAALGSTLGPLAAGVGIAVGQFHTFKNSLSSFQLLREAMQNTETFGQKLSVLGHGLIMGKERFAEWAGVGQQAARDVASTFTLAADVAQRHNDLAQGQINDYREMAQAADSVKSNVVTLAEAQEIAAANAERSMGAWAARYEGMAEAAEKFAMSQEAIDAAVSDLMTAIDGPVGAAQEKYREQHESINAEIAEEQEKLGELRGQLEETGATVGTSSQKYQEYQQAIAESEGKIDSLNGKLGEAAAAHREHIQSIIFDMIQARLAADGWTEAEYNLAMSIAENMGMIDEETATATKNVNKALGKWQAGVLTTEEFIAAMEGTVEGAMDSSAKAVESGAKRVEEAGKVSQKAHEAMGKGAEEARDRATEAAEEIVSKAGADIDTYLSNAKEKFGEATQEALEKSGQMKDDVTTATGEMETQSSDSFRKAKEIATSTFEELHGTVKTSAEQTRDDTVAAFDQIPTQLMAKKGDFNQVGQALMDGVKAGIDSKAGEVAASAARAVRDAVHQARSTAQVSSPSRLMIELGKDLLQGLIVGVDAKKNEALEKVEEIVSGVVDAFQALLDLSESLGALGKLEVGGLGGLEAGGGSGSSSGLGAITNTVQRLIDWADHLYPLILEMTAQLQAVKEKSRKAIEDATQATDVLTDLLDALIALGSVLQDVLGQDELPWAKTPAWMAAPSDGGYSDAFANIHAFVLKLALWTRNLYLELGDYITVIEQDLDPVVRETMDAVDKATTALESLLGKIIGLAGTLREIIGQSELAWARDVDYENRMTEAFSNVFEFIMKLLFWTKNLYLSLRNYIGVIEQDLDPVVRKTMDAVAKATSSLDGLLGALTGLADTLRTVLEQAELPWARDVDYESKMTEAFSDVFEFMMKMMFWAKNLYLGVQDYIGVIEQDLDPETRAAMAAVDKYTSTLDGLLGSLLGLGETIQALLDWENTIGKAATPSEWWGTDLWWDIVGKLLSLKSWFEKLALTLGGIAENVLPKIDADAQKAMDAVASATASISKLLSSLLGLGETIQELLDWEDTLGKAATPSEWWGTDIWWKLVAKLLTLKSWFEKLAPTLSGIAEDVLPKVDEDAQKAMDAVASFAKSISGLLSAFSSLASALDKLSKMENVEAGFEAFDEHLDSLATVMRDAYLELEALLTDDGLLSDWAEEGGSELAEKMGVLAKAISNAFGPIGRAISLIEQLGQTELEDLEAGFANLDQVIDSLQSVMATAYRKFVDLLTGPDPISLEGWTDEGWVLGDKLAALSKAISNVFGPFDRAIGFLSTLANVKMEDMLAAFGKLDVVLPKLQDLMRATYEMLKELAEQELTDWTDGASELADKTGEMGETVQQAFSGVNAAIGAMSSLIDLMWDLASVAGSEHLEAEDFAGLAWGVDMFMSVLTYAMQRLKAATAGLDLETLANIGEDLKSVGDGLKAMADGMKALIDLVGPTTEGVVSVTAGISAAQQALAGALGLVTQALVNPPWAEALNEGGWYSFGTGFVNTLTQGIYAGMSDLSTALGQVSDMMPHSPAKKGPLSKPVDWDAYLTAGLSNAVARINAMMQMPQMAMAMPQGASAAAQAALQGGEKHIELHAHYPQERPHDFRRQKRQMELVDMYYKD